MELWRTPGDMALQFVGIEELSASDPMLPGSACGHR